MTEPTRPPSLAEHREAQAERRAAAAAKRRRNERLTKIGAVVGVVLGVICLLIWLGVVGLLAAAFVKFLIGYVF